MVVNSLREVWDFFEEEGIDMDGADEDEILNADEGRKSLQKGVENSVVIM